MTDYTKSTNFTSKDSLSTGNPLKIIKGAEFDTEFNAIATAISTKYDSSSTVPVTNGGTGSTTASGARTNLGLAIGTDVQAWDADLDTWATKTAPSGAAVGTTDTQTLTNKTLTSPVINGMGSSILTSGTAVASTSGTSIDFTSIPSWVKRITVMFSGVSTNSTSLQIIQLGTSSGVQTTGYAGTATTNGATVSATTGILVGYRGDAANVYSGAIVLTLLNAATGLWVAQGVNSGAGGSTGDASSIGATKTLSGTLDRVRITTVNGTDTFDAGSINILYE